MAAKDKPKSKCDPVEVTILRLANEFQDFAEKMPPDLKKWASLYFETLYEKLDFERIASWLDGEGHSYWATQFDERLNRFLYLLKKWENKIHIKHGIYNMDQLIDLQSVGEDLYKDLTGEYDDICITAKKTAQWLRNLAQMIVLYRKKAKSTGVKGEISASRSLAVQAFKYALSENRKLLQAKQSTIYEYISHSENRASHKNPYKGISLPKENTWKAYLREGCRVLGKDVDVLRTEARKGWLLQDAIDRERNRSYHPKTS